MSKPAPSDPFRPIHPPRPRDFRLRLAFLVLAAFALLLFAAPGESGRASAQQRGGSKDFTDVEINPDGYTSARVCGRCHTDIYNSWKKSLHAFSLSDPIFDTAYMRALKLVGDEAKRLCLRCHAPMVMANGDYDLNEGVTREGVSCDFCHTVREMNMDDPEKPYRLEPGLVKRGIIKEAGSPTHEVAYSALHGTSEFCGACHNYYNTNGVPVMTTYEEWLSGPYAKQGVQCQNCHMALGEGKIVTEEVKQIDSSKFHLHSLIHDTDQLRSAMEVKIAAIDRRGRTLRVAVDVENVGSGHMLPTGMPMREVVLTVQAAWGDQTRKHERRYARRLLDEAGRTLVSDVESMLFGVQVGSDNRIAPKEKRTEHFEFTVPESGPVKLSATASYFYSPQVLDKISLNIKLAEAEEYAQ